MTNSWLGDIPFSEEEESDKLNRQIDLMFTKAPKKVGESHPKHRDFYWSGAKWLNVNDLPKSGKAAEIVLPGTASRYNNDGSKRDLGVGFGEPSSVKSDTDNKAALLKETAITSKETPNSSDPQIARSTVFTRNKEGEALGVMTRNQRKNWEADNPDWQSWQPEGKGYATSSAINNEGNPVPTKEIKTETVKSSLTNDKFQIPEGPTQNFWNKDIPLVDTKGIKGNPTFGIPKGIDLDKGAEIFNPANMAKDMQAGPSFAEGMKMNPEPGGISGAAALKIGSMILGALSKKKGGKQYVREAGTSDISKSEVPIASNIEDFYSGLRLT